jgi:parallel beta-helix repeat protein
VRLANRIIAPFVLFFTVGLLVTLLMPSATYSTRAAQAAPSVTSFNGLQEGQVISGKAAIEAVVSGNNITQVVFNLNGPKPTKQREKHAPYFFMGDDNGTPRGWDTTQYPDGDYTLTAVATNSAGSRGTSQLHFRVTNSKLPLPTESTATIGNSYFVSMTGNDTNPGTIDRPWRTLGKAANTLQPGDSVLVRGGTYVEQVTPTRSGQQKQGISDVDLQEGNKVSFAQNVSGVTIGDYLYVYRSWKSNNGAYEIVEVGTNYVRVKGTPFVDEVENIKAAIGRPIIYKSYPNEQVVIDGQFQKLNIFNISDKNYLIIDGFQLTRALQNGIYLARQDSYNVIKGNKIYNNNRTGVILYGVGTTYNIVDGNEIYSNGLNGPGEGIYLGVDPTDWVKYSGGMPANNYYNHIINNYIHDSNENALECKPNSNYSVVERNLFDNNSSSEYTGVVEIVGCSNTLVYNNIVRHSKGLAAIELRNSRVLPNTYEGNNGMNAVFNNIIVQSDTSGISIGNQQSTKVYNNTIFGNRFGIMLVGSTDGNTGIKNNIVSGNADQVIGDQGGFVVENNLIEGASSIMGEKSIRVLPLFVDAYAGNFHLTPLSPAIDKGLDLGIDRDVERNARPKGSGYDLGAYEY